MGIIIRADSLAIRFLGCVGRVFAYVLSAEFYRLLFLLFQLAFVHSAPLSRRRAATPLRHVKGEQPGFRTCGRRDGI
jgi:hypothetical protein